MPFDPDSLQRSAASAAESRARNERGAEKADRGEQSACGAEGRGSVFS